MKKIMQKIVTLIHPFLVFAIFFINIEIYSYADTTKNNSIIAPLAASSLLLDGTEINGNLVVVGERGHILYSNDGYSWQQANVPTQSTLTAVRFIDKNNGWAVGHDAVILRTSDGGVNWIQVYTSPEDESPLLDIWFGENGHGIAIGAYGLYLVSDDKGLSWQRKEFNVTRNSTKKANFSVAANNEDEFTQYYDLHLNSLSLSDSGVLYIAAEAGRIYRSTDYGDTWQELTSPYIGSLFGVLTLKGDSLLVFGLRGHLFRSDNSGDTWKKIDNNTQEMLTNAIQLDDRLIIICGLGGTILMSDDGGQNFSLIDFGNRKGYLALIISQEKELITVGEDGVNNIGNLSTLK